jgi:hypothetical protein
MLQALTNPGYATFFGSLAGSSIALLALLAGALLNAHLNRKRDDAVRADEAASVAAALKGELSSLNDFLITNAEGIRKLKDDFIIPDLSVTIRILPAMLPKFGLLNSNTVQEVIVAYVAIEGYGDQLILLGGKKERSITEHRRLVSFSQEDADDVAKLNRKLSHTIQRAIKALDQEQVRLKAA